MPRRDHYVGKEGSLFFEILESNSGLQTVKIEILKRKGVFQIVQWVSLETGNEIGAANHYFVSSLMFIKYNYDTSR
ncbi:MAG: hypothetical protein EA390_11650 [Balneolaceae bacterium]|nr:MAG: hypothetical protein EA390_11650 [Balneolaceae bacterium]